MTAIPFGAPGQPFSAPSSSPSAPSIVGVPSMPDLLMFVRHWHRGKKARGTDGVDVTLAWFALEVFHADTATQIGVVEIDPAHTDEQTTLAVEARILNRAQAFAGMQQVFEVRCHFRSDDGVLSAVDVWTGAHTAKSQNQQWGSTQYSSTGFGASGGGPASMGGGMGGPAHTLHVLVRGNIDAAARADAMTMRAMEAQNQIIQTQAGLLQYYATHDMESRKQMDEMRATQRRERLEERYDEIKLIAIQACADKLMQAAPLVAIGFNRWITAKNEEKYGTGSSRAQKALTVLRHVYDGLKNGPAKDNPEMAKQALVMAGVRPEDVDEAFDVFQEFTFEDMQDNVEKKVKATILGSGPAEPGAPPTPLQRLKAAVGMPALRLVANDDGKAKGA